MGQQQLLLIVLGVIIVGLAIVAGISMFESTSLESRIDAITSEALSIANDLQKYYKKEAPLAGGDGDYDDYTLPDGMTAQGTIPLDEFVITSGEIPKVEFNIYFLESEDTRSTWCVKVVVEPMSAGESGIDVEFVENGE